MITNGTVNAAIVRHFNSSQSALVIFHSHAVGLMKILIAVPTSWHPIYFSSVLICHVFLSVFQMKMPLFQKWNKWGQRF
jgi:hypothetical protein